tara:strand:+ start:546 stop:965 length:420 start_codon:yes stop_codon:yes gene_type:complete
MNYQNKNIIRYLKGNLSPKQFRLVKIAPYILAFFVLVNFIFTNLQYEANKPIHGKYDDSKGIMYYYDKESNELFTGKASWILRFNNQKFEGSYKDGQLHGMSRIWHENGNLAEETVYDKGVSISKTSWDENGIIIIENQ